ncbi:MFS transporter [Leptolyngbya sp. 7M]|uniref:MFS transporter n=1 Tax=Leptolyngbya sp. 7M TaxID=2812896 RepID=UPI001B8C6072|nr:MFS transporter [Leptolyngbya sp. 7M]QYO67048.1 MFS transporter [Leptolyngbya sp. 7M]
MNTFIQIPKQAYLLSICQGLGITVAVIAVTVSALAGEEISGSSSLATIPYGFQFFAIILMSSFLSLLAERIGRKKMFLLAALIGFFAGALAVIALDQKSFLLLIGAHFLLGFFLTSVNLYRFSVLEITPEAARPYAINLVLFGGVLASLLGPFISRNVESIVPIGLYKSIYVSICLICIVIIILISFLRFSTINSNSANVNESVNNNKISSSLLFIFSATCGGLSYGLMNLLMTASSLEMKNLGFDFNSITWIIQIHVFSMFFPSLFSGFLIKKIGIKKLIVIGILIQVICNLIAFQYLDNTGFLLSLLLLGISWNFLYVGSSYIVGQIFTSEEKFKAQGINDTIVHIFSTSGAMFAGWLLAFLGWQSLNLFSLFLITALLLAYLSVMRQPSTSGLR